MHIRYTLSIIISIIILHLSPFVYSQDNLFQKLEQRVYILNNQLKYNESQALLLPVLQSQTFNASEKYQAAILLSYTYKRVFDYQSTLKFLEMARKFAQETTQKDQYLASIEAEEAFVYFDTHDYDKADQLTALLEKSGFKHISLENKSKLIMQRGYLLFLDKKYVEAEAIYDQAIQLMKLSTPCHLPMALVKKMQLYNAMNRLDLLQDALKQSTFYADSCHIIKYHLYTYEELLHIYESRNDFIHLAETQKKVDSLNTIYAKEVNISSLHNQKENILLGEKDEQLKQEHTSRGFLTITLVCILAIALVLFIWLILYKRKVEVEFLRMKAELEYYLAINKEATPTKTPTEKKELSNLSERQLEVLNCMASGMSNKQIANKLFISENTVKYHIKNIYQLLEINDRKDFLVNMRK
ncbi:hypothetical protein GCM10028808_05510 [Spirosoma migulaei]